MKQTSEPENVMPEKSKLLNIALQNLATPSTIRGLAFLAAGMSLIPTDVADTVSQITAIGGGSGAALALAGVFDCFTKG
jgi:hypothetical protein